MYCLPGPCYHKNHVVNIFFTLSWRECDAVSACCSFTSLLKKAGDPGPDPRVTTACPGDQHLVKGSHPLSDHSPCWSPALEIQQTPLSSWAVTGLNRSLLLGSQHAKCNRGRETAWKRAAGKESWRGGEGRERLGREGGGTARDGGVVWSGEKYRQKRLKSWMPRIGGG